MMLPAGVINHRVELSRPCEVDKPKVVFLSDPVHDDVSLMQVSVNGPFEDR